MSNRRYSSLYNNILFGIVLLVIGSLFSCSGKEELYTASLQDLVGTQNCNITDGAKSVLDDYAKKYTKSNIALNAVFFDNRETVHFANFNIAVLAKIEASQQFPVADSDVITFDMYFDSLQVRIPAKFGVGFFPENSDEMTGCNLGYRKNKAGRIGLAEMTIVKGYLSRTLQGWRADIPLKKWIRVKIEKKPGSAFFTFSEGKNIIAQKSLKFLRRVTAFSFYTLGCGVYVSNARINSGSNLFGKLRGLALINKFLPFIRPQDKTGQSNSEKDQYVKMIKSGDEYRKSLLAIPDIKYSFSTAVKEHGTLQFGYGFDNAGHEINAPTAFKIVLTDAKGQSSTLFKKTANPAQMIKNGWADASVDLQKYAGQTVTLDFITRPAGGVNTLSVKDMNIAVWSNPVIAYPPKPASNPNILLISIDTQRADRLGAYGYKRPVSTNIDAFAKEGTLFDNTIAPAPYTLPSHMSIFTSLYPHTHGVTHWTYKLDDAVTIYGEIMKQAGYRTAAFTAGNYVSGQYGFYRGFDSYYESPFTLSDNELSTTYEKTRAWLENNHQYPFSLFFHTFEVHAPYFREEFVPDSLKNDTTLAVPEKKILWDAKYDSHIKHMDTYIGKLFADLKRLGVYDNTIIVLTSDHGEELFDRTDFLAEHGHTLYRDQIHVPLIVVWPGKIPAGKRVPNVISSIDIAPTILDYAGITVPNEFNGRSLRPFIEGKNADDKSPAFSECTNTGPERKSVVFDAFHYIFIPSKRTKPGQRPLNRAYYPLRERELFRFYEQPIEKTDILKENPDIEKFLQLLIDDFITSSGRSGTPGKVKLDPETLKRLKSLGYIK